MSNAKRALQAADEFYKAGVPFMASSTANARFTISG
ncbi:MAG: hypothetical protein JWP29_2321 [Rhodoferax sp.]|nr:hypothetical protein [Rhodoferax sp.]